MLIIISPPRIIWLMSNEDDVLKMFIEEVFVTYDTDRSGSLDVNELHKFLNYLFQTCNDPRRFDEASIKGIIEKNDFRRNGALDREELFVIFKDILASPPPQPQYPPPQYPPQYLPQYPPAPYYGGQMPPNNYPYAQSNPYMGPSSNYPPKK